MVLEEGQQQETPIASKGVQSPKNEARMVSQASSCPPDGTSPSKKSPSPKDSILSIARKFSTQPVQNSDPCVWGVLTAISSNARKRRQGINIPLTDDEHRLGRLIEDARFRIESNAVSGSHCRIYRKKIDVEDVDQAPSLCVSAFLKDTSTNGTYLNWDRMNKNSSEAKLKHGDIISFAAAPQHELAFAFVYREVSNSTSSLDGAVLKRKAEGLVSESKRLKGIGIRAPEGPVSLDDVRSLQRSNMELRKELESHVLTIERMHNENRATVAHHENELKELKESVSQSYLDEIKELRRMSGIKQKELVEVSAVAAERQQAMVDLNERLNASMLSRIEKDEIISSQKVTISEIESQLDEERNQRKEERDKALADHKAAVQRAHIEAQVELKRQSDAASRQERELQEVINKLQESDKENRLLVESLRAQLEDTRESLVLSNKKVRQLEVQFQEEQQISANERRRVETLENERERLRKELESEKQVAREEARAKVSALELEMTAAIRDLSVEKQHLQGAKERIILRETQLRAFYSDTEDMFSLFAKQKEKLKAMQRTLEDEENYENMSVNVDLNKVTTGMTGEAVVAEKAASHRSNNMKESSAASTPRVDRVQDESSSDEASVTEKHDCNLRNQEEGNHTQDLECASADRSVKGAFGSDIDGVGTAPEFEGDPIETERVLGTESPGNETNTGERNISLAGDTMQLDDEVHVEESGGNQRVNEESGRCSQSNDALGSLKVTKPGTISTADLLTSEVAGSWAISTAPSVHGENDSPRSGDMDGSGNYDETAAPQFYCSDGLAAGSQIVPNAPGATKMSQEREALNEMMEIVAPGFREQFSSGISAGGRDGDDAIPDSDTEEGSDHEGGVGGSVSDADTQEGSDKVDEENEIDESEDDKQEDSVG